MDGYFKVHRKILDSQVFAHPIALKIWIWCLSKVTYKEKFLSLKIGKGYTTVKLNPGEFIFGRFKAEDELNIDGSTIYKWIQKFASNDFEMITIKSNNHYSIITICKWDEYQNNDTIEVTTKEQPSNNHVTAEEQPCNTNNKDNKEEKDNNNILEKNQKEFEKEVLTFENKYDRNLLKAFYAYWSEGDKKGRMKKDLQKTWDTSRRLVTWENNNRNFTK